jgi:hypothetical protein
MQNTIVCPFCHMQNCKLELARRNRSPLTLESVGVLSPEQLALAGKLEPVYFGESSPSLQSYRDMLAPGEAALALESAPVDTSWITAEEPRETVGGLLEPSANHWFSLEHEESRLASGLRRPDAGMPDEQDEKLRQLFLSKPAPKQRKLSLEQLTALGWLADETEPVQIDPSRITKGGLLEPL